MALELYERMFPETHLLVLKKSLEYAPPAAVAELVYAHVSGTCGRKPLEVRVLSAASIA